MAGRSKVVKEKFVEDDFALYETFIDYSWTRSAVRKVAGTRLESEFDTLTASWKEAAGFHRFPWLMVIQAVAVVSGYVKDQKGEVSRFVSILKAAFDAGVGRSMRHMKRKGNHELIDATLRAFEGSSGELADRLKTLLWETQIREPEIQFGIWGSQAQAYCALFFAYEWFITGTYRLLTGDEKPRPSHDKFWTKLTEKLGTDARSAYWDQDPQINIAQLTRHSFAHTGGKAKDELRSLSPPLYIVDKEITIRPSDTRALYTLLKGKVESLVDAALPKL